MHNFKPVKQLRISEFVLAKMCGNRFLEALVNSLLKLSKKILEEIGPTPPVPSIHQGCIVPLLKPFYPAILKRPLRP